MTTLTLDQSIAIRPLSIKLNLKRFSFTCFAFIVLLLAVYVFQANDLVRGTYTIKQYAKQLTVASQENNNLKINYSKSNSLNNVETLAANLNFERISDAKYIQLLNSQVAVNK